MWKKIFGKSENANEENSASLFEQVNKDCLPRHIAIIMDGNGRWATGKGMMRSVGHTAGVKALKRTLKGICNVEE